MNNAPHRDNTNRRQRVPNETRNAQNAGRPTHLGQPQRPRSSAPRTPATSRTNPPHNLGVNPQRKPSVSNSERIRSYPPRDGGRTHPITTKPQNNKRILIAILSIVTLALLVTVIIMAFAFGCSDRNNSNNDDNNTASTGNSASSALLPESADMGQAYMDSLIFVGDSNTAHLVGFEILNGGRNTNQVWIPDGYTITLDSQITRKTVEYPETGEKLTIAQAAAKKKPEYLVISLGTNGVSALDEEQFKYCYKKLLDAIKEASPNTKIMVQSIYPVTSTYEYFSNETINKANGWLLELAEECGIKYLDTASVLKDESGAMKDEYNSAHNDGYHINKAAAIEILNYIRTHGWVD